MAYCEDFPCCGHEPGCCPDFDASGKQINMKCVCGAPLPADNRSSLCEHCLHDPDCPGCNSRYCANGFRDFDEDEEEDEGDFEEDFLDSSSEDRE